MSDMDLIVQTKPGEKENLMQKEKAMITAKSGKMLILGVLWMLVLGIAMGFARGAKEAEAAGRTSLVEPFSSALPIVTDKISFKLTTNSPSSASFRPAGNELPVYQKYEELTNVHIDYEIIERKTYKESMTVRLASGSNLADIVRMSGLGKGSTGNDLAEYGDGGIIIPLNDLIDKYAPHINKWFQEPGNEMAKFIMASPDGRIWGIRGVTFNVSGGKTGPISTEDQPFSQKLESIGGRYQELPIFQSLTGYLVRWPNWLPEVLYPLEEYFVGAFPKIPETEDENSAWKEVWEDTWTYATEMQAKLMTGQESLDKFDEYLSTIKKIGGARLLEIRQQQYDRFLDYKKKM